jgi:2-C-methyl-D-erythritol 4-phosphate cytidylyltransferase
MFIANLDIIRACFTVGGSLTLKAGTSDNIKVTIQDDLDGNVAEYFECNVRAIKQE